MFYKERITLFLSADNNYAPFIATTIVSVLIHTNSPVDFYVLEDGITEPNKIKIQNTRKFFKDNDFNITFITPNLKQIFNGKYKPICDYLTMMTYVRLFIPELEEAKKLKSTLQRCRCYLC